METCMFCQQKTNRRYRAYNNSLIIGVCGVCIDKFIGRPSCGESHTADDMINVFFGDLPAGQMCKKMFRQPKMGKRRSKKLSH